MWRMAGCLARVRQDDGYVDNAHHNTTHTSDTQRCVRLIAQHEERPPPPPRVCLRECIIMRAYWRLAGALAVSDDFVTEPHAKRLARVRNMNI